MYLDYKCVTEKGEAIFLNQWSSYLKCINNYLKRIYG